MSKKIENPQLTIVTGEEKRCVNLNLGRTTIGRKSENAVVIPDPSVSGFHAAVSLDGDEVYIEDLSSTNGTFINDEKIKMPYRLRDETSITIGMSTLIFTMNRKADQEDAADKGTPSGVKATIEVKKKKKDSKSEKSSKGQENTDADTGGNDANTSSGSTTSSNATTFRATQSSPDSQPYLEFLAEDKSVIRTLNLDKTVNPLGRLGVGVAAISFGRNGWVLSPVDGLSPMLNGAAVTTTAALLKSGDVIVLGDLQARFIA